MLSSAATITGSLFLLQKAARLGRFWYREYAQTIDLSQCYGADSWALITGAAEGIGRAHADRLAKDHKFNLVLVDRNDEGLQAAKEELNGKVVVHTIKADLASNEPAVAQKVWNDALGKNDRDISIVLNNVGHCKIAE
jgi:short-subunit dehydrogenase